MKKTLLCAAMLISCFVYQTATAQIHINLGTGNINLGLNIGSQPEWGPVGYDHAEYYYMPDIDTYYDVTNHQYVYFQNNVWIHSGALPPRYANYDLYHGHKVVVNERNPWERAADNRTKYASFKGRHDQPVIRDSRDKKYANHYKEEEHRDDHHRP